MTLRDFKEKQGITYRNLAKELGITRTRIHRICIQKEKAKITLPEADRIVKFTDGAVTFSDLLGDC